MEKPNEDERSFGYWSPAVGIELLNLTGSH